MKNFSLIELCADRAPTIHITDVGAMWLGEGEEPHEGLLARGAAKLVGFEPVQAECDKLNTMHAGRRLYLPYAIGDGTVRTFHVCNKVMTSSLYEPNSELLDKFQNLENLTQVVERHPVQTHRLDDIDEVADTDYLKVDVQGAEWDVFQGAKRLLRNVLVVHTEVEFVPMYREQPLFGDVDRTLRESGFLFHNFFGTAGRMFKPLVNHSDINASAARYFGLTRFTSRTSCIWISYRQRSYSSSQLFCTRSTCPWMPAPSCFRPTIERPGMVCLMLITAVCCQSRVESTH